MAEIRQYGIYLVNLDPTVGHEIRKPRPCLVISPDEMNRYLATVIIAPLTSKSHRYPTRVPLVFQGTRGWIVLDQIRTVDGLRIVKHLGSIGRQSIVSVKRVLGEMLVE